MFAILGQQQQGASIHKPTDARRDLTDRVEQVGARGAATNSVEMLWIFALFVATAATIFGIGTVLSCRRRKRSRSANM